MKQILYYKERLLCVALLLGIASFAKAQESKEKNKDLNRELTLEREYNPTVQDANKVSSLPAVKEPVAKKVAIDYASYGIADTPDKEITVLPSGKVMTDVLYNKKRGYFNLGIGTNLNINGDFGYHILSTEEDKLNVFLSHRSTNTNVKYLQNDEEVKAKLNDNLGGVNYMHNFGKTILNIGGRFGYSLYNHFGYPVGAEIAAPSWEQIVSKTDFDTNQADMLLRFNAGVESEEGEAFRYLIDLGYQNFSHKYGPAVDADGISEQQLAAEFDVSGLISGSNRLGVKGDGFYFLYNEAEYLPKQPSGEKYIYKSAFENHYEATVTPYFETEGENWKIHLGANISFYNEPETSLFLSPDIMAELEVSPKTKLYLEAKGGLKGNSMYDVNQMNRYVDNYHHAEATRTLLDGTIGLRCGEATDFWFNLFAGYKIMKDEIFFIPYATPRWEHEGLFGNPSSIFQGDANVFRVGADLRYNFQQYLDLGLKAVYNAWDVNYEESSLTGAYTAAAYGKPEVEINASVDIKPMDKLSVLLDYYIATGRTISPMSDEKFKNINELNLTASYTINDTFVPYIKLNNLLFQRYELVYGYPMQGFNAMVGININF